MEPWEFTAWQWLVLVQHELLLFAGIFFLIGALDELAIDLVWLRLALTRRTRPRQLDCAEENPATLSGPVAVFLPAWREARIIGPTIRHLLAVWPQRELRLYLGCYRNDPATLEAAMAVGGHDDRLRIVVHDRDGPTTKADCLNRLYRALTTDEQRSGRTVRMVVLHDAEDMVDPAAIGVLDASIAQAEMVQLPVRPEPQSGTFGIGSHYCDEFAEAHGKTMVVRDALGAGLPLAGVGCAIRRDALDKLAMRRADDGPFATDCLTEDYELGIGIGALGGRTRFLRVRAPDGRLVATRACFPARLDRAVRQKTRWLHGIAFQGWDRLGWSGSVVECWMRLRDRRGPFAALILAVGYLLLILATLGWALGLAGIGAAIDGSPLLQAILWCNLFGLCWRIAFRTAFTAREYGLAEGLWAIPRMVVANTIAIMAGRRALAAYARSLLGETPRWDKTEHDLHPEAIGRSLAAARG